MLITWHESLLIRWPKKKKKSLLIQTHIRQRGIQESKCRKILEILSFKLLFFFYLMKLNFYFLIGVIFNCIMYNNKNVFL